MPSDKKIVELCRDRELAMNDEWADHARLVAVALLVSRCRFVDDR
jgi:hypothetical protein